MNSEKANSKIPFAVDQPNTIMVDGVELPSWYFVWCHLREANEKIERLTACNIMQAIAIIILAIWQIWK